MEAPPIGLCKWNQVFQRGPGSFHVSLGEGNPLAGCIAFSCCSHDMGVSCLTRFGLVKCDIKRTTTHFRGFPMSRQSHNSFRAAKAVQGRPLDVAQVRACCERGSQLNDGSTKLHCLGSLQRRRKGWSFLDASPLRTSTDLPVGTPMSLSGAGIGFEMVLIFDGRGAGILSKTKYKKSTIWGRPYSLVFSGHPPLFRTLFVLGPLFA